MYESEKRSEKRYTCYWFTAFMASNEIAEARKIARAWEAELTEETTKVQVRFVEREIILQQDLKPGTRLDALGFAESETRKPQAETLRTGESFKKVKGSNPGKTAL